MSNNVIVIATSAVCGICTNFRGDGSLDKPKNSPVFGTKDKKWDKNFIKYLVTGGSGKTEKFSVVDIHFTTWDGLPSQADQINIYSLDEKNELSVNAFRRTQGKMFGVGDDGEMFETDDDLSLHIPSGLASFTKFFPTMGFFDRNVWEGALVGVNPLYGIIVGADGPAEKKDGDGRRYFEGTIPQKGQVPKYYDIDFTMTGVLKGTISLKIPGGNIPKALPKPTRKSEIPQQNIQGSKKEDLSRDSPTNGKDSKEVVNEELAKRLQRDSQANSSKQNSGVQDVGSPEESVGAGKPLKIFGPQEERLCKNYKFTINPITWGKLY